MEERTIWLVPKWEYRKEANMTIETLNEIGQDGWELAGYTTIGTVEFYIFKRPIYDIPDESGEPPKQEGCELSYLNDRPISELVEEVERLDEEDFAREYPDARAKSRGFGTKLEWNCHKMNIKTAGDLITFGRSQYRHLNGVGKLNVEFISKAFENLYGVKGW